MIEFNRWKIIVSFLSQLLKLKFACSRELYIGCQSLRLAGPSFVIIPHSISWVYVSDDRWVHFHFYWRTNTQVFTLSKGYTVCRKSAHAYKRSTNVPRDQANTVPRRSFVLDPKRIIVGNVLLWPHAKNIYSVYIWRGWKNVIPCVARLGSI